MNQQITTITVNGTEAGHIGFAPIIKMWAAVAYPTFKTIGVFETRKEAEEAVRTAFAA